MDTGFVGLDPVGCRLHASRFEEAALESLALAEEYREIGRVGLMEFEFSAVVRELVEVHDELQQAVKILRSKSDEVEAFDGSWNIPLTGRSIEALSRTSGGSFQFVSSTTTTATTTPANRKAKSGGRATPPKAQAKVPPKVGPPKVGPKKVGPKKLGPPAPAVGGSSFRVVPGPGNWAGVDPTVVVRGGKVADGLIVGSHSSALSDREIEELGAWWWTQAHTGKDRDRLRALCRGLSLDDRERLENVVGQYDWAAYANVQKLVPPGFDDVVKFLATDAAHDMGSDDLVREVQRRLKITDARTLDAVRTYIRYQVGTTRFYRNPNRGWPDRLADGWFLPGFFPEKWNADLASAANRTGGEVLSLGELDAAVDTFVGLFRGRVPDDVERRYVRFDLRDETAKPVAVAAGVVVGVLAVAAIPEAALVASLATALGEGAVATAAATVIVTSCVGAISGLSAGAAERFVLALNGELEWDAVLDANTVGRDALLGGLLAAASYGVGRAMGIHLAKRAAARAANAAARAETAALKAELGRINANNDALRKAIAAEEKKIAENEVLIAELDANINALKKVDQEIADAKAELAQIASQRVRPSGVPENYVAEIADNGKGTVWRAPGTTGNGGIVRVMDATPQYPNGYVRFYNSGGQPVDLLGKPGGNATTHIPRNSDGTFPVPKGWKPK